MLDKGRKKEVRDLLYEYKDAFSLRDVIGMCPNIEFEVDITDKTPFFIRPFYAKEEDSHFGQRDEEIMLFRNFERRFLSLFKSSDVYK